MILILPNKLNVFQSKEKNFNTIAAQDAICVTALTQASVCLITKIFYQTAIAQNLPLTLGKVGVGLSIASSLISIALRHKRSIPKQNLNNFEFRALHATTRMPIYFSAMAASFVALSYVKLLPLYTMIGASVFSGVIGGSTLAGDRSLYWKFVKTLDFLPDMLSKPTGAFR